MAPIDGIDDRFAALLAERLRARAGEPREQCPEVALIAAYCERSLPRDERDAVERHLAGCAPCRAELSAIARAAGELEAARATEPRLRRWWSSTPVGLAVAGSIAVIVAIGLGRDYYHQEASEPARPPMMRMAANSPPAVADQAAQLAAKRIAPANELNMSKRAEAPVISGGAATGMMAHEAARPAPAAPSPPANVLQAPQRSQEIAGAPAGPSAQAMSGAAAGSATSSASVPTFAKPWRHSTVTSADGSVRWEFGTGGIIERLLNGGLKTTHVPGITVELLAGSAPSSSVCWIVGRAGTVLRTIDGLHWEKVNSPTSADLVSVSAQSAAAAVVADRDSHRYATLDGGQSWQAQ
ncbi:MAG TPA: zf-HC2 domain-containing protein [Candidatus Binataceae bacterium]|nr:zf-HC2 domain-containing protein [Candidatus Binataceae bacterium]